MWYNFILRFTLFGRAANGKYRGRLSPLERSSSPPPRWQLRRSIVVLWKTLLCGPSPSPRRSSSRIFGARFFSSGGRGSVRRGRAPLGAGGIDCSALSHVLSLRQKRGAPRLPRSPRRIATASLPRQCRGVHVCSKHEPHPSSYFRYFDF